MRKLILAFLFIFILAGTAQAVTLTWTDNSGANSDAEDGFRIERAATSTGAFTQIGQVGPNIITFVDSAGVSGNCYRVRAFNQWGNSGYSNVACVGFAPASPSNLTVNP